MINMELNTKIRLATLAKTLEDRGVNVLRGVEWSKGQSPDFWLGVINGLFSKRYITADEVLSLCLELKHEGASDETPWFKQLVRQAYGEKIVNE